MGHYDSCRIDWEKEEKGCKSPEAKDGKHEFVEESYGLKVCKHKNCKARVYLT